MSNLDKDVFLVEFNHNGEIIESWRYGSLRDYKDDDNELFYFDNLLENDFDFIGTAFKYNVFGLFEFQDDIVVSSEEEEEIRKIAKDYLMERLYIEKVEKAI